ncbi:hypothetical protein [Sphingobacterium tabacisoli]|uniref:Uncharacterized protein n=1 Tax=Sphingobacterium tabacisoli TaxID=2044855 RepID=A0ABW5L4F9_9SPHI|nr:hypothetical protein [Sphingobacterium tabacisoli]
MSETFLITLKRKRQYKEEFKEFLLAREKLQERLICYDELEICAYFLFERSDFMKVCNRQEILFSDPTLNLCFDLLYSVGFGFKDELDLEKKLKIRSIEAAHFIKYHKLKPADRISNFGAKNKNFKR